ncbi:MAG: JAB domain-containing protein [Saprospiraceae bacterium]|nr:JAB domain-containing protein [Saprospiraceae bacterium]
MKAEHLLLGLGALLLLGRRQSGIGAVAYPTGALPPVIDDPGINGKATGSGTIVRSREINLRMKNGPFIGEDSFKSADDSAAFLKRVIGRRMQVQEVFVAVFLNYANRPIGYMIMSVGGISGTVVDPPIIAVAALKSLASGVIVSHNHPSGNLRPSQADMDITKKLNTALSALNIRLLDHIIVTANGYYSFANEGMI